MEAPRFRVIESAVAVRDTGVEGTRLPAPLRDLFGPSRYLHVFVNIEARGKRIAAGHSCGPVLEESQVRNFRSLPSVVAVLKAAAEAVSFTRWETAFGHHCELSSSMDIQHIEPNQAQSGLGCHLIDAAILDALLVAHGTSFLKGMSQNIPGMVQAIGVTRRENTEAAELVAVGKGGYPRSTGQSPNGQARRSVQYTTQASGYPDTNTEALLPIWRNGIYQPLSAPQCRQAGWSSEHAPFRFTEALAYLQARALGELEQSLRSALPALPSSLCCDDPIMDRALRSPGFATRGVWCGGTLDWLRS
mgnify:CR=1 FL=1